VEFDHQGMHLSVGRPYSEQVVIVQLLPTYLGFSCLYGYIPDFPLCVNLFIFQKPVWCVQFYGKNMIISGAGDGLIKVNNYY